LDFFAEKNVYFVKLELQIKYEYKIFTYIPFYFRFTKQAMLSEGRLHGRKLTEHFVSSVGRRQLPEKLPENQRLSVVHLSTF
jgi:hypothetical protein